MDLRHQIAIARAWLPMLVVVPLLAAVAAFLFAGSQAEVYQVSAHLLPEQFLPGNPEYANTSVSRVYVVTTNFAFIAKSREALSEVRATLHDPATVEELGKRVDADVNPDTAGLTITARAGSPEAAAALANAVARTVQEKSSNTAGNQSLHEDLDTVRARLLQAEAEYERLLGLPTPRSATDELALANALSLMRELTTVYDTLNATLSGTQTGLIVVDEATAENARKIAPQALYLTLLAAVAAFVVASGVAWLLEYVDDRVRDADAVQEVAGLSTLGTVGHMRGQSRSEIYRLAAILYPRSSVAEAYRTLRTNIEFAALDAPVHTLLVTSANPSEGKTVTAANLAVVFAQAGRRVLLVDADLRKPGVHTVFNLPNTHGLTTLIRTDEATVADVAHATEQPDLRVVTSGPLPPNPAELLGSHRMRAVVERLAAEADLVILDSAPVRGLTDAAVLASFLDGTLLVVDARSSHRQNVRQAREALARAGANVLGASLNRVPEKASSTYYGYYGDNYETAAVAERRA